MVSKDSSVGWQIATLERQRGRSTNVGELHVVWPGSIMSGAVSCSADPLTGRLAGTPLTWY
jgi:hypothetical protein